MGRKGETSFLVFIHLHILPHTFEHCRVSPQGGISFAVHDGLSDIQFPLLLMVVVCQITTRGI